MNKQIEEMAEYCCFPCEMDNDGKCLEGKNPCKCYIALTTAEALYNAGYRRQEDVARAIFAKIENFAESCPNSLYTLRGLKEFIKTLKKKYEVKTE